MNARDTVELFERSGAIDYVRATYGVLHTMSLENAVCDIDGFIRRHGA